MNDTLWNYDVNNVSELCKKEPPKHVLAQEYIQEMNGDQLLDLYLDLWTNTELKVVVRVALRKWLENYGADYYHWCRRQVDDQYKTKNQWIVKSCWIKQIGEGSFSKTHLLLHKSRFVVLKLQKLDICNKDREVDLREVQVLQTTSHKNILRMFEYGVHESRVWLLLEHANSGTLKNHIDSFNGSAIDESKLVDCYTQIVTALDYIHEKLIIHRDAKATNIFILKSEDEITYKLGDFNLSRTIDPELCSHAVSYCGTIQTMAPETLSGEEYRYNADIWSLLCVLLFTLTGNYYNPISWDHEQILRRIPEHYKNYSKVMFFITFLHEKDPIRRPSARQCLEFISHPKLPDIPSKDSKSNEVPVLKQRHTEDNILCRGFSCGIPKEPNKKSPHRFIRKHSK